MPEYIEREAAIIAIRGRCNPCGEGIDALKSVPAADVAPVRHGRWDRIGIKVRKALPIYPSCSACGMVSAAFRSEWEGLRGPWKYCPNCGAKMDGGEQDA